MPEVFTCSRLPAVVASPARIRGLASSLYRPMAPADATNTMIDTYQEDAVLVELPAWGDLVEDNDDGG